MKMLPEQIEYISNRIRNIIALDPLISIRKMQELIEKNTGHSISDKLASRLMVDIRKQAVIQSDDKKINQRLAEVRERYRVLVEELQKTIYWKQDYWKMYRTDSPSWRERQSAIKLVAQLEVALFRAELMVGAFEKGSVQMKFTRSQSVTLRADMNE